MERVSVGLTMYHLALGAGTVKKTSDKFIIIQFGNEKLKYKKHDVDFLIFFSKKEMFTRLSEAFKIPYYTVEAISNKVLATHRISSEYYKIFDYIFEHKYKRYYGFVCESMEWLIIHSYISIYSSYDSEVVKRIVENFLDNKCYGHAIRISICYNKDSLLQKCCKTYMSEYQNDLDRILQLFRFCIKAMLKLDPLAQNKEKLYNLILSLILKLDAEDYLLMKLEELLFDQFIQQLSSNVSKMSFENLLKYYCRYHNEGDYATLLDNLIKYTSCDQEAKQHLNIFVDAESKQIKVNHMLHTPEVDISVMQLKQQLPIILKERGITELLHFTNIKNIPSIVTNGGLWPRSEHHELGIVAEYSDEIRLDNRLNATSLSLSFPNYRMLYQKLRQNNSDYAILVFDSTLLYEENEKTFFYYSNAASNNGRMLSGCDIKSFNRLFDTRLRRNTVPQNYTTDSQAEILIEGIVDIKYVKEIHVRSLVAKEKLYSIIDDQNYRNKIQVNPFYFDYENGKKIWEAEALTNGQTIIF